MGEMIEVVGMEDKKKWKQGKRNRCRPDSLVLEF